SVLIFSAVALPCSAQTILKSEPLALAPYEVAFVQGTSCPAGKVMKVTGAIRGLHRKRVCVVLSSEQASLADSPPYGVLRRIRCAPKEPHSRASRAGSPSPHPSAS